MTWEIGNVALNSCMFTAIENVWAYYTLLYYVLKIWGNNLVPYKLIKKEEEKQGYGIMQINDWRKGIVSSLNIPHMCEYDSCTAILLDHKG